MTFKQILNQKIKVDKAQEVLRVQQRKLEAMAKSLAGQSGLVTDKDSVFKISIGYGYVGSGAGVSVEKIGDKSTIAAILQ